MRKFCFGYLTTGFMFGISERTFNGDIFSAVVALTFALALIVVVENEVF